MNPIAYLMEKGFTIWNVNNWGDFEDFVCVKQGKKLFPNPNYDKTTQALALFYLGIMSNLEKDAVDILTISKLKLVIEFSTRWTY